MSNNDFEMSEEETWDAIQDLYEEGKIDHVLTDETDEPAFTLNEKGMKSARQSLRENDAMVLFLIQTHLSRTVERRKDESEIAEALVDLAKWVRDDVGVNIFRVMERNPEAAEAIDFSGLSETFIEQFDPERYED